MRNRETLQSTPRGAAPGDADRYFERDGVRLRYRDEGTGQTLVLVHGWPLNIDMWQPQVDALRGNCRLLRMDRRGFGRSGGPASIEEDARDLATLLEQLEVGRATLVGMSQGARVAMNLATLAARRISGMVLDGAPALAGKADEGREEEIPIAQYRRLFRDEGIAGLRRQLLAHPFLKLRTDNPETHRLLLRMIESYDAGDLEQGTGAVAAAPDPAACELPVLVINGTHDTGRRRGIGDALARQIPRSERLLLSGSGHLPNLDNPDAYNRSLREFVERLT